MEAGSVKYEQVIIMLIDRLGRLRALNDDESMMLERMIRKTGENRRKDRPWTDGEDKQVRCLMIQTAAAHAGARFRANDNVQTLAAKIGRTPDTVRWRMNKLRKMDRADG